MKIRILNGSKMKNTFAREGEEEFLGRFRKPLEVTSQHVNLPAGHARGDADELLIAALGDDAPVWLLDERGTSMTTGKLRERIEKLQERGVRSLTLVIGGPAGVGERMRRRADFVWSLSPLTLGNEIARLVLLEQLYRVYALTTGHPYHRE